MTAPSVFVVQQDERYRVALIRELQNAGYRVHSSATPELAWARMRRADARYDVLVTDFEAEGDIDGVELARLVSKRHPDTMVLYATAYTVRRRLATSPSITKHAQATTEYVRDEMRRADWLRSAMAS